MKSTTLKLVSCITLAALFVLTVLACDNSNSPDPAPYTGGWTGSGTNPFKGVWKGRIDQYGYYMDILVACNNNTWIVMQNFELEACLHVTVGRYEGANNSVTMKLNSDNSWETVGTAVYNPSTQKLIVSLFDEDISTWELINVSSSIFAGSYPIEGFWSGNVSVPELSSSAMSAVAFCSEEYCYHYDGKQYPIIVVALPDVNGGVDLIGGAISGGKYPLYETHSKFDFDEFYPLDYTHTAVAVLSNGNTTVKITFLDEPFEGTFTRENFD